LRYSISYIFFIARKKIMKKKVYINNFIDELN